MIDGGVRPDTEPTLLPTPSLDPGPFEDFTDRVLSAHRFCVGAVRKVIEVERWGRRGDGQQGVDLVGRFCDGATAAWQCKRYAKLTPADVREFVSDCSYLADEYYLVYSGEASASVRAEIAKYPHWALVDRCGLGRLLDELPLHKRRDVLDQTWGRAERKRLLEVPGEDAFLSLAAGLLASMGTIGDCYDNAMMEPFWGTLQLEILDQRQWNNREELANAIFEWIECWYNPKRRHSSIGMHSPVTFEALHTKSDQDH